MNDNHVVTLTKRQCEILQAVIAFYDTKEVMEIDSKFVGITDEKLVQDIIEGITVTDSFKESYNLNDSFLELTLKEGT